MKRDISEIAGAFILDNVLTADECKQFIEITEQMGYDVAPLTVGADVGQVVSEVRDNKRVMWDSNAEILAPIWERIKDFMPQSISSQNYHGDWVVKGLNERLRFYRCN